MPYEFPLIRSAIKKGRELMSNEERKRLRKDIITGALGEVASANVKKSASSIIDKIGNKRKK